MSRARTPLLPSKAAPADQFDLFLPYVANLPLRDQREMMERPFFSLAKSKRLKPIDYTSPDGLLWVNVSANPNYGMATIWDADILIYCASVLADMARRGVNDVPRKLHIMPYDLLRAIGRPTTGRAYELLAQALDRLVSTTIKTNIRAENRREATFSWLDGWTQLVDEKTERSRGMTLELSNWFWEGVMMKGGVLSIDRAYFDITGGRERWLYKVARKHAGGAGEAGFAISMPVLFEKSGAEGEYRRFKFEILKLAEKDALPGYALSVEQGKGAEPLLRMRRVDGKDGAGVAGPGAPATASDDDASTKHASEPEGSAVSPGKPNATPATDDTPSPARTGSPQARKMHTQSDSSGTRPSERGRAGSTAPRKPATSAAQAGMEASTQTRTEDVDHANTQPTLVSPRPDETIPATPVTSTVAPSGDQPGGTTQDLVNASGLIRSAIAGLTTAGTRGFMTDETIDHLRETCPGWDLHALHAEFERWVAASPERTPADWQRAFIGWVKRHHEKNRHGLRG